MDSLTTITKTTETPTKQNTCSEHGEYISKGNVICGKTFWTGCPECQKAKDNAEKESERNLKLVQWNEKSQRVIGGNVIPKRYQDRNLANYEPPNDRARTILKRCTGFVEKFEELQGKGTSLVFSGKPGTGKTHLACAIANHLLSNMVTVAYKSVYSLIADVKATFGNKEENERDIVKTMISPDLLILDEVGVQFGTEFERVLLHSIINTRYENMQPTILVSNLNETELSAYLGERIIDRMYENYGTVFNFDWESFRRLKLVTNNNQKTKHS